MSDIKINNSGFVDPSSASWNAERSYIEELLKKEVAAQFEKLLDEHKANVTLLVNQALTKADESYDVSQQARSIANENNQRVDGFGEAVSSKVDKDDIYNGLDSTDPEQVLSAPQGRELKKMAGDIIPFKHPEYGEIFHSLQTQIGNLNYGSMFKANGLRYDSLIGITNALKELLDKQNTDLSKAITGVSADAIRNSERIDSLNAAQTDFFIRRLANGDSFEIPVNSVIFFTAGNNKIVKFSGTDKDGLAVTLTMTTGLCLAFETNITADNYWTEDELKNYYRLFIGYGTGITGILSSAFDSHQDIMTRGATITNTGDTNVWLWVIQKGSET